MVILDRYDKKTVKLILGSVSFLIILLSVLGYFSYEKYISKKKLEEKKQSLILKESRDRNNYESFILNIENGSAIDEFKELYTSLLIDKNNFKKDGWDLTESSCSGFSCNILFDRAKNSTFKYKEILKDEQIYRPTFNENELRFTGVNYSFASNDNLHKKKGEFIECSSFIADAYYFQTLLNKGSMADFKLEQPMPIFNFKNNNYSWAEQEVINKGSINLTFKHPSAINFMMDYFQGKDVYYQGLNVKNDFKVEFIYYCI